MNADQRDAIHAAYLGICVLQNMCRKVGLTLAVQRSQELLVELGTIFPFIPERIGRSALRDRSTKEATAPEADCADEKIVETANTLARELYGLMGYEAPEAYRFDRARHPMEVMCWRMACRAFEVIDGTEVEAIEDGTDE